ncbi:MAG: FHA domain-containing protein [Okeania sp. SIO3I5]|uniref:FHA domain-containing protein n=1 Tax=Okeania sp. SIO3I5 TaxID=2607805 RepID=UPI0013BC14B2|nr:FHA domain-containing protein [Okeania sp. SIO3I5]NEQ37953.1 FHA domain-containing protein [Okeania sp. SIO3I5]
MKINLTLALERANLKWTLQPHRTYTVGHNSDCYITLPSIGHVPTLHLEFRYDQSKKKWCVKNLGSSNNITFNSRVMEDKELPILGKTRIAIIEGQALLALPEQKSDETESSTINLITSTRLLSGYAYLNGIFSSFELLDYLRVDPYKAKIPASSLKLDEIAGHAARSALITVLFSILALAAVCVQILLIIDTGFSNSSLVSIIWGLLVGFDNTVLYFLANGLSTSAFLAGIVAGLLVAFELVYLRWFMARQFIKKNYKPNYQVGFFKFLEPLVKNFRELVMQVEQYQNVIVFGGNYPFTGYGELIPKSSWTVPIDKLKAPKREDSESKDSNSRVDIPVSEFYKSVDAEIAQQQLPKLQKFSYLFVDGFELKDSQFLAVPTTQPGVTYLEDPLLNEEHNKVGSLKRAYRVYQYTDTERDYVLTHFLRFINAGSITFVESAAYILTGIDRKRFSLVSTLEDTKHLRLIKALIIGIILGIFPGGSFLIGLIAVVHIGVFIYKITSWQLSNFRQKRSAEFQEEYNYGVDKTLREYIAEPLFLERKEKEKVSNFTIRKVVFNPWLYQNPIGILIIVIVIFLWSLVWIPLSLAAFVNTGLKAFLRVDRDIKINFDYYGAQDTLFFWKTIQTTIFNSTIKTLKNLGVDTSEFEFFKQVINNGIMIDANNITNNADMIGSVNNISSAGKTSNK